VAGLLGIKMEAVCSSDETLVDFCRDDVSLSAEILSAEVYVVFFDYEIKYAMNLMSSSSVNFVLIVSVAIYLKYYPFYSLEYLCWGMNVQDNDIAPASS
jgi:hypothetical protein